MSGMKWMLGVAALLMASGAQASFLRITNLDKVAHTVRYETSGSEENYTIAPGETEMLVGQPAGRLSLVSAPKPVKATSAVQSDGLLSDFIGNGRTMDIPAEPRDEFVIWPGGEIGIQRRMRTPRY